MQKAEAEEEKVSSILVGGRGRNYIVPFERIVVIQKEPVVVPVPDSPAEVIGITIYEGRTVPYLRLDEEQTLPSEVKCGILLKYGDNRRVGMAVEEIGEMYQVPLKELEEQSKGLKYQIWKEILV